MRQLIFNRTIVLSILLIFPWFYSQANKIQEKSKEIHKSYKVSESTELFISNSFGKVHIETWSKNEIDVKVNIIAKGKSHDDAQTLLDRINIKIDDSNPQSVISYETSIKSGMKTRNNGSFEINYQISMPISNALEIINSFGDTYLDNHSGDLDIIASYGNLATGNLTGDADINLSFGNGVSEIDAMEKGDLKVSFSALNVDRIGIIDLNAQFSTMNIEKAGVVDLIAKYGKIIFEEVEIMEAEVDFAGFKIEALSKSIDLDVEYGNSVFIGGIGGNVDQIRIRNSFSPVTLELIEAINANLTAEMSFCDLKYQDGLIEFKKIIKDNTSKEYEGKIGSGGNMQIDIISEYGNVRIREY
ncbi:hypothetical protein ACFLU5_17310 [Bacteroidota bacterium]